MPVGGAPRLGRAALAVVLFLQRHMAIASTVAVVSTVAIAVSLRCPAAGSSLPHACQRARVLLWRGIVLCG